MPCTDARSAFMHNGVLLIFFLFLIMARWISDRKELIKLFLIYKLPRYFLPSSESIVLSVLEEKRKLDFQNDGHGGHFEFPIGSILSIFDLQVAPILPTKFQVNWPFGSGIEA